MAFETGLLDICWKKSVHLPDWKTWFIHLSSDHEGCFRPWAAERSLGTVESLSRCWISSSRRWVSC